LKPLDKELQRRAKDSSLSHLLMTIKINMLKGNHKEAQKCINILNKLNEGEF